MGERQENSAVFRGASTAFIVLVAYEMLLAIALGCAGGALPFLDTPTYIALGVVAGLVVYAVHNIAAGAYRGRVSTTTVALYAVQGVMWALVAVFQTLDGRLILDGRVSFLRGGAQILIALMMLIILPFYARQWRKDRANRRTGGGNATGAADSADSAAPAENP